MELPSFIRVAVELALQIYVLSLGLSYRDMRDLNDVVGHHSVVVDGVEGAFHKLSTLQKVVDFVSEHSLAMSVTLNLEHELPTSHTIGDLQSLIENLFVSIHQIEAKHESLLLDILIVLKLEVRNLSVLLFRSILDGKRQLSKRIKVVKVVVCMGLREHINKYFFSLIISLRISLGYALVRKSIFGKDMLQLIDLIHIISKRTIFEAYQRVSLNVKDQILKDFLLTIVATTLVVSGSIKLKFCPPLLP